MPDLLEAETLSDDPTEDEPVPEGQSDYGPNNERLPPQLVEALRSAITERQLQEKFSRRREVMRDRKLRFYEQGHQYLFWNNTSGGFAIASPGGLITNAQNQSVQCPNYVDSYNIFQRYLLILTSVLCQNLPGVVFQPIDPGIPEDNDKAKTAEDYAKAFDRMNDVKSLMMQMVRMMGLSGRTVSWTRTEADAQRFGRNDDGTPKLFQRTTMLGTLETKCLIMAREFDRNFPYLFIYDDPDVLVAKTEYPSFADEIKAGSNALEESQYERTARLGVLIGSRSRSQLGDSLTHLVGRINAFLRMSNFTGEAFDAPFTEGDGQMTIGEKLRELFPEGVRAVFMGQTYVASYAECMDDHLDIAFPYEGDGMFRSAMMEAIAVVQDNLNDLLNWAREKVDTGAGSLWVNGTEVDIAAITSQRAAPNAIRPAKQFAKPDQPLEHSFFKEQDPDIPETIFKLIELMRGELPEFLLAALPALQGSEMSENKTASGYAQATVQAKGQLAIVWSKIQRMWARIRYQSALAAARCEEMQGQLAIPGKPGEQTTRVDMDKLRKGDFGCYPDEDSSFPESTQQKRATFGNLLTLAGTSPQIAQLLDNPDNVAEAKELMGFSELVFLPAEARNKQLHEIELLLQQAPIPPTPQEIQAANVAHAAASIAARTQGAPEPPAPDIQSMLKPSIPVDELDYHQWEGAKGQEWLSSAARRQEDQKGNQAGVLNVKLHTIEHLKRAAAMMAAQAPPPMPVHHAPPKPGPQAAPASPPAPPQPVAA
jgi:hypothetical protein